MKENTQQILDKIKRGEIKPESKWRFLAHDYFFWFMTGLSIIFGSLAVASVLHGITAQQVGPLREYLGRIDSVPIFIQTLPYLWLIIFAVLLFAAWFNYKHISFSYRKHNLTIVMGVFAVSLFLGFLLFVIGAGKQVDERVRERVPLFERQQQRRENIQQNFIQKRKEALRKDERRVLPRELLPQREAE